MRRYYELDYEQREKEGSKDLRTGTTMHVIGWLLLFANLLLLRVSLVAIVPVLIAGLVLIKYSIPLIRSGLAAGRESLPELQGSCSTCTHFGEKAELYCSVRRVSVLADNLCQSYERCPDAGPHLSSD